jgi:hypothetical protein
LNLSFNKNITDVGLSYIKNVKNLYLSFNENITNLGLSFITDVKVLDLYSN